MGLACVAAAVAGGVRRCAALGVTLAAGWAQRSFLAWRASPWCCAAGASLFQSRCFSWERSPHWAAFVPQVLALLTALHRTSLLNWPLFDGVFTLTAGILITNAKKVTVSVLYWYEKLSSPHGRNFYN